MRGKGNWMTDEVLKARALVLSGYDARATAAQAKAAQSYGKLLHLAETVQSGQSRTIAQFLASTYDSSTFPWDPYDLRGLDVEISDHMLACLDALRWAKLDLYKLVPDGAKRVEAAIEHWGMKWPAND